MRPGSGLEFSMALTNGVPRTYEEAVATLASWHTEGLGPDVRVFSSPDPKGSVVRLIEVSGAFPASGEARPFTFGRSKDFPYPSSVIQVTPEEWEQIQRGAIRLPSDWELSDLRRVDVDV